MMEMISVMFHLCLAFLLLTVTTSVNGEESCTPVELKPGTSKLSPIIEKYESALLILLGFGGFSVVVAVLHNVIRKYVFKDSHKLDTVFDAGGRVTLSLTAVTVTSQILWPGDFLQSSTLISKTGIAGSLWYTLALCINILLFPALTLKLKTHAPGAKTFPQILYVRFGKAAHITFCVVALMTNLVITTSLLLAGKTALEVLTKDINTEFIMLVLAALFGCYCMIGGLGTTFYISYFNTALTFISLSIFILQTKYFPTAKTESVASFDVMYKTMSCIEGPEGNYENSMLSFRSRSGIIYGLVIMIMVPASSICDQSVWQSRIAAKPSQSVWGFLIAAILFFPIPTTISFTAAMSYLSMSFQNGTTHLLAEGDIDNGYITPFAMESLFGSGGGYLLLTMVTMALMSTGSGEVMGISSIIVYDFYKTYINPYRKNLAPTDCILCGKNKVTNDCNCPTTVDCKRCEADIEQRRHGDSEYEMLYSCTVHGKYRHYEDQLRRVKSWIMVFVIICIVPYGLLIVESGMDLHWAIYALQVMTSPFLPPVVLAVTWAKATGPAVITGGIAGLVCCFVAMLITGSTYEGGLDDFFTNTAQDYSILAGLVAGVVVGGGLTIIISLCTHKIRTHQDVLQEWAKTMSIDNPLNPFRVLYEKEIEATHEGKKINEDTMEKIFRVPQRVAIIGGSLSLCLFLVVIPAVALSYGVLNQSQFEAWLSVCQIWCLVCTVFAVLVPPIRESMQIWRQYRSNKEYAQMNGSFDKVGAFDNYAMSQSVTDSRL